MKIQSTKIWSISRKLLFASIFSLLLANVQAQTTEPVEIGIEAQAGDTVKKTDTINKAEVEVEETQIFCRHEFSIWTAGGMSALNYKPSFGERDLKAGGTFGIGYTYYFHPKWGIHAGLEAAVYNTTFRFGKLKDVHYARNGFDDLTPGWTGDDEIIDYHTEISNYTERQQLYSLNIPLMLQFQTPIANGKHQFFASAGAKLGIPIQNTYKVSNATLYTWYYDHKHNVEIRPDPTDYGIPSLEALGCFYNLPYSTRKKANDFRLAGMASVETGVKFHLNPKLSLYVGAYFDYGFNNVSKHSGKQFFDFDPEYVQMHSNSVLSSQYSNNGRPLTNFTDKVAPIAFGLKVRMGINVCHIPRVRKAKKAQVINVTVTCNCTHQCNCNSKRSGKGHETRRHRRAEADAANLNYFIENTANNQVPQREPYTKLELEEFERARKEYGELEDMLVLQLEGYEVNQSRLTPRMLSALDTKIEQLQKYNNSKYIIICEGHSCDIGTANYNMSLGRRRAEVVRNRLIQKGFDPRNVKVASKGQTMPIVENSDEAHRKINRRVVILIKLAE